MKTSVSCLVTLSGYYLLLCCHAGDIWHWGAVWWRCWQWFASLRPR